MLRRPNIPKITPDARSWRSAMNMSHLLVGYAHIKKCAVKTVPTAMMLASLGMRVCSGSKSGVNCQDFPQEYGIPKP